MAIFYVDKRTGLDPYTAAEAQNSATPWKTLRNPCDRTKTLNGEHTIQIAEGSGPYIITDLGALSQNALYPNHQAGSIITWEWNGNSLQLDINVNDGSFEWHQSAAAGKETWYYLTAPGGTVPTTVSWDGAARNLPQVKSAVVNGSWAAATTNLTTGTFTLCGRYATDNWSWGDYDTLGFSTLYVKYNSGVNPTGGNPVFVPIVDSIFTGGYGGTVHRHVGGIYRGANVRITTGSAQLEFFNSLFYNADSEAIAANSATLGQTYKAHYCVFKDCGHAGFAVTTQQNMEVLNCTFINVHTMGKLTHNSAYTVTMRNCASKDLLAGAVQHDNALPTLVESNNQFHIDPNTTHGTPGIAITGGVRQWTVTDATDLPPNTDTSLTTSVDPLFVSAEDYRLQSTSPCINTGVSVSLTADFDGNPIYGLPDIGAYEYQYTRSRAPITIPGPLNVSATITAGDTYPAVTVKAPLGPEFQAIAEWTGEAAVDLSTLSATARTRIGPRGMLIYGEDLDAADQGQADRYLGVS